MRNRAGTRLRKTGVAIRVPMGKLHELIDVACVSLAVESIDEAVADAGKVAA